MVTQSTIKFDVLTNQNSKSNEEILLISAPRLSHNCQVLYEAFLRGEKLTGKDIVIKYGMTEYRARIRDLREAGLKLQETILDNGCKEWFL